jgi:hypothetical protein
MQVVGWTLIEEEQFIKLNLGTTKQSQCVKINAQLIMSQTSSLKNLLLKKKHL